MMIRFGVIGTGRIADRFVKTVHAEKIHTEIACVYNPRESSAKAFCEKHGVDRYTCDLNAFWKGIDAVYIASPHETHYDYANQALQNGIHVLCEKPMALDETQVSQLFALAKEKGLVLFEAIKTAYCPGFLKLLEVAHSGVIGEIRDVEATFTRLTDQTLREYQNAKYGGSVLEFGSYVLLPVIKLLGTEITDIRFQTISASTGVDSFAKINIEYRNAFALAKVGLGVKSEGQLIISGTKGYIYVPAPWWMTSGFEVRYEDPAKRDVYETEYRGSGLQYEMAAFLDAIEGKKWKHYMTEEESMLIAKVMRIFLEERKRKTDYAL